MSCAVVGVFMPRRYGTIGRATSWTNGWRCRSPSFRAIVETSAARYARIIHITPCAKDRGEPAEATPRSMTGIYRIDQHGRPGWRVALQRQNRIHTRKFQMPVMAAWLRSAISTSCGPMRINLGMGR